MPYYAITLEDLLVIRNCSDHIYAYGIVALGNGFKPNRESLFTTADKLNQVIYRTMNRTPQNSQLEFDF